MVQIICQKGQLWLNCKVDVLNQENQKSYNQIDVGFAVELELKEVIGNKLVSERQV
jgi:hypothetical protein